ncbi:hypothetical protein HRH25_21155 [Flavisolibacter sp. BT320]|nr:hypothetical protein [Flavisolibacter longurius]
MKKQPMPKGVRITAILLLAVVSLNALAAGYSFITDPSGNGLGISTTYLKHSAPFNTYFIPGLVLFCVIGVWGAAVAVMAFTQSSHYPFLVFAQGCILLGWIVIQLLMVTIFHPLHLVIGLSGLALMILGWLINDKQLSW